MPSSFVHHYVGLLDRKESVSLNSQPLAAALANDDTAQKQRAARSLDAEETALYRVVIQKAIVRVYAATLDHHLAQATQAENEAEWWADIERSSFNVISYFIQTLPLRVARVLRALVDALRSQSLPLSFASISRAYTQRLSAFSPTSLLVTAYPHLHEHPMQLSLTLMSSLYLIPQHPRDLNAAAEIPIRALSTCIDALSTFTRVLFTLFISPVDLTRAECRFKRQKLQVLRDECATSLGRLADMRLSLDQHLRVSDNAEFARLLFSSLIGVHRDEDAVPLDPTMLDLANEVTVVARWVSADAHVQVSMKDLVRPGRLTRLWPRLLLGPPLFVIGVRALWQERSTLYSMLLDVRETARGFLIGWVVEPIKDVLRTVRAGEDGSGGVIVRKEGVMADVESLERMTLDLARDKLHYSAEQLQNLSKEIRAGDLTQVLRLYEQDIRRPVWSAMTGSLLRNVFVQVQKAKVDIDQALTGIDRLLKSQELTFGFVGVAPSLLVLYLVLGYLGSMWRGRGTSHGSRRRRAGIRVERLLLTAESSKPGDHFLQQGLLLMSLAQLRAYADEHLPRNSRLREGFLEDVGDLEDPGFSRDTKLKIIERMWRSWAGVLGWGTKESLRI
ncbi:NCA2-domain-containing protein [Fistulina hepatica ATCC 64428]|uniref:NCA2-domain-containing protein n=1 Tax=Fistulina hepatica ATCC 64428 TaxID=1128425 RepID=A0A0D7A5L1_9AGAR|nr:NCA2-domain-containing protein [Fistulina hepatica ATCC 64428]